MSNTFFEIDTAPTILPVLLGRYQRACGRSRRAGPASIRACRRRRNLHRGRRRIM